MLGRPAVFLKILLLDETKASRYIADVVIDYRGFKKIK